MATAPIRRLTPQQQLVYDFHHPQSTLEQFGVPKSINNAIGLGAAAAGGGVLLGGADAIDLGSGTAADEATAAGASRAGAAGAAAGGAASGAGQTLVKTLAKDATAGAVLSTLIGGGGLKYSAIWAGLMLLGIALILIGVGKSTGIKPSVPVVIAR